MNTAFNLEMQRHRVGGFAFSFLHLLNQTEEKIKVHCLYYVDIYMVN